MHSIVHRDGKLLILCRNKVSDSYAGYWDTPGGTLEDGEDPAAGAKREAREETGLEIDGLSLFFCDSVVDAGKDKQFVTLVFLAETAASPESVRVEPREHSAYRGIDPAAAAEFRLVLWLERCLIVLREKGFL